MQFSSTVLPDVVYTVVTRIKIYQNIISNQATVRFFSCCLFVFRITEDINDIEVYSLSVWVYYFAFFAFNKSIPHKLHISPYLFIFHCNLHLICLLLTAIISHVNHVIHFSTCLLSVLAMLFFSEGHDCISPLLLLSRNSFTEKTPRQSNCPLSISNLQSCSK